MIWVLKTLPWNGLPDPRAGGGCSEAAWPAWLSTELLQDGAHPALSAASQSNQGNCICCWGWCVWLSLPAPQGMAKAGGSSPTERELIALRRAPNPSFSLCLHLATTHFGMFLCPKWLQKLHKGAPRSKAPITLLTILWDPPASALAHSFFHLPETHRHQPSNVSLMGLELSRAKWGL